MSEETKLGTCPECGQTFDWVLEGRYFERQCHLPGNEKCLRVQLATLRTSLAAAVAERDRYKAVCEKLVRDSEASWYVPELDPHYVLAKAALTPPAAGKDATQ